MKTSDFSKICALVFLFVGACNSLKAAQIQKFTGADIDEDPTNSSNHRLTSSGLPIPEHEIGTFGARTAESQSYSYVFPKNPAEANSTRCLFMGPIGFAINGVPLFNPYSSSCCDAVELESFDSCNGHPTGNNAYHYHQNPVCAYTNRRGLVGVALDGFPIYGPKDTDGTWIQASDLDECNGKVTDGEYRYHILRDTFPYILGCFKGEIVDPNLSGKNCPCTAVAEGC